MSESYGIKKYIQFVHTTVLLLQLITPKSDYIRDPI